MGRQNASGSCGCSSMGDTIRNRRSERIAIYGGSYGGYASLVGATFTPDLFQMRSFHCWSKQSDFIYQKHSTLLVFISCCTA